LLASGSVTLLDDAAEEKKKAEQPSPRLRRWPVFAEAAAVVSSPVVSFFVLRLRAMAPTNLPDPAMHTIYLVDPHDVFLRYGSIYKASAGLRESARVGFLIPARVDYLLFGAVPGFFVTRYLFALIAVGPAYLLMRRLYGRPAGVIAVVATMSCPIVITAWGTDYPDSAVVSYLIGGLACLAMPCGSRERRLWLALAAVLLTMAVWAQSVSVPLVISTLVVYFAVRIYRDRSHLASDVAMMGVVAVVITAALILASGIGIGQYNFITPTWDAYKFLSTPAQVALWHTKGWRWLVYLPYLLVPPAVAGAWLVVFVRRLRSIPTGSLIVGLACIVQILVFAYLQFFGSVEMLEEHYFSSILWGSVCLTVALTVAEAARPFLDRGGFKQWVPAALVLAVPLVYEAAPREPAFKWVGVGVFLAFVIVAGGIVTRTAQRARNRIAVVTSVAVGIIAITGGALYLSADPVLKDPYLNTISDPAPAYSTALGASAGELIDIYHVSTLLPGFVRKATYKNEQLLMWWPPSEAGILSSPTGMYHFIFNTLPSTPPQLTNADVQMLDARRPAELLLLNTTGGSAAASMQALGAFHPVLLRSAVLRSGDIAVYVWLFNLKVFGPAR
jgi:hypothetical protein